MPGISVKVFQNLSRHSAAGEESPVFSR